MDNCIQDLNDDCLILILARLPILDRFRADRVCKRWKELNKLAWHHTKALSLRREFWGLRKNGRFLVNRQVLHNLLKICGSFVTHVDLRTKQADGLPEPNVRVKSCKYVFTLVHELCPNVRSIDAGDPFPECTLEFVASHFTGLTHFSATVRAGNYEDSLSLLFSNNKNLKSVWLDDCVLNGDSLLSLNAETLEEFYLTNSHVYAPQYFYDALASFRNVHTLSLECVDTFDNGDRDLMFEGICKIAVRIQTLSLRLYKSITDSDMDLIITKLVNLEKLHVDGTSIATDYFLSIVGDNCKKLKTLQISDSYRVTNAGIASVASLPELRHLELEVLINVTDRCLSDISKLSILKISWCSNVQAHGLTKLLRSSRSIRTLECVCCTRAEDAHQLIEAAQHSESKNLIVKLDYTNTADSEFVEDEHTFFKSDDRIVTRIRRTCFDCFTSPRENCTLCCHRDEVQVGA